MSISWPEKQLSKETIVSIRQKRLKGRLNKKVPMFAGQYFQEALEKRPDYFLNGKGRYDLWRVQFTNFEVSRINYLLQHPDQVITDQTIIGELLFTDL